jgi:hypothetical protein
MHLGELYDAMSAGACITFWQKVTHHSLTCEDSPRMLSSAAAVAVREGRGEFSLFQGQGDR